MKKKVSIVGFGRFGQTLYRLLKDDFHIATFNSKNKNIKDIYEADFVFYCVPINQFEKVIKSHRRYFKKENLLIDVLSVKLYPKKIFEKYLKNTPVEALLTHPMFGPDSNKEGFDHLPIIIDQFRTSFKNYLFWKNYFKKKKLTVIEMSAKEHDYLAARSQGLTHFVGRLLEIFQFKETPIDSLGAKKLHQVMEQTTNDTWELFYDLQHYNPYTKTMRIRLGQAFDWLFNRLLPKQTKNGVLTIGIQGGKGSFNEEAINYYVKRNNLKKVKIRYLYTTDKVLQSLYKGEIDWGQFALWNSKGGLVRESLLAMAKYKFKILEEYAIKISHCLMVRKDVDLSQVSKIMTHPQVFAQCRETLSLRYPFLKQIVGQGKLIDQAVVAKYLASGKISKNIAVIGSKVLAQIYKLKIVAENLQDLKENYTTFLLVSRR